MEYIEKWINSISVRLVVPQFVAYENHWGHFSNNSDPWRLTRCICRGWGLRVWIFNHHKAFLGNCLNQICNLSLRAAHNHSQVDTVVQRPTPLDPILDIFKGPSSFWVPWRSAETSDATASQFNSSLHPFWPMSHPFSTPTPDANHVQLLEIFF